MIVGLLQIKDTHQKNRSALGQWHFHQLLGQLIIRVEHWHSACRNCRLVRVPFQDPALLCTATQIITFEIQRGATHHPPPPPHFGTAASVTRPTKTRPMTQELDEMLFEDCSPIPILFDPKPKLSLQLFELHVFHPWLLRRIRGDSQRAPHLSAALKTACLPLRPSSI
jgi:hypothetical protein